MAILDLVIQDAVRSHKLLRSEIEEALDELPEEIVLYFFSVMKVRGRELQRRFRSYQYRHGYDATFADFIKATTDRMPISKAFMPEGCKQFINRRTQMLLRRVGCMPKEWLLPAALAEIYFGRGTSYVELQKHHCSSCPVRTCPHKPPRVILPVRGH